MAGGGAGHNTAMQRGLATGWAGAWAGSQEAGKFHPGQFYREGAAGRSRKKFTFQIRSGGKQVFRGAIGFPLGGLKSAQRRL